MRGDVIFKKKKKHLKFHTNYLPRTLKYVYFIKIWKFKSYWVEGSVSHFHPTLFQTNVVYLEANNATG